MRMQVTALITHLGMRLLLELRWRGGLFPLLLRGAVGIAAGSSARGRTTTAATIAKRELTGIDACGGLDALGHDGNQAGLSALSLHIVLCSRLRKNKLARVAHVHTHRQRTQAPRRRMWHSAMQWTNSCCAMITN